MAEAFDQKKLAALLGPHAAPVRHVFPRRTPEYVRFEEAPIVEPGEPLSLPTGEQVICSIKYYAFAVVVVQIEVSFDCDWNALLAQASRWIDDDGVKAVGRQIAERHLDLVSAAVVRPNKGWLQEEYMVVEVREISGSDGAAPLASELVAYQGQLITQLIRGEVTPLAPKISDDLIESSISYYPSDLIVIGASAALVYDAADAGAAVQVLEYAKMQLLETRYYDGLMTRLLSDVYDALEEKRNFVFRRWTIPRDAKRFNTIRLDVMELTERIDNAIKFVSDAYYARVYRLAAGRIGLPEYRDLVDEKLRTVGELYDFMVEEFNEARSFVLEVAVAILALVDVIFLFRGR